MQHAVAVQIGDQVYLSEGGEEAGSVRAVSPHELVIYIENAQDFVVPAQAVTAVHDGKVILDPKRLDPAMIEAIAHAHERETRPGG
jgi:hypothetical protein